MILDIQKNLFQVVASPTESHVTHKILMNYTDQDGLQSNDYIYIVGRQSTSYCNVTLMKKSTDFFMAVELINQASFQKMSWVPSEISSIFIYSFLHLSNLSDCPETVNTTVFSPEGSWIGCGNCGPVLQLTSPASAPFAQMSH